MKPLPLSYGQEGLWFLDQLFSRNAFYNGTLALRLRGRLDEAVLGQALSVIVERHEALRTRFVAEGGRPRQVVDPPWRVELGMVDLCLATEEEIQRVVVEHGSRPFDLAQDRLLQAGLLRLGPQEHVLLLTMHHIVSDGWSLQVLVDELGKLYRACQAGEPSPLPPLPVQYADFAVWQREWMSGPLLQRQLEYWRGRLAGAPPALDLPTDHPRPRMLTFKGARQRLVVPEGVTARLRRLSQAHSCSLFMTLLAAFTLLLHRYIGQHDIVVGTPMAGRNRPELEGLIGFFVNTLVLRTPLGNDPKFSELLDRVRQVTLEAYGHHDLPFEQLVQELQPARDLSRNPIVQVLFQVFQPLRPEAELLAGFGELEVSRFPVEAVSTRFDLEINLSEVGQELVGSLIYSTDLYEPATAQRMVGHYLRLLQGIAEHPDRPLSEFRIPAARDRQRHPAKRRASRTAAVSRKTPLAPRAWIPNRGYLAPRTRSEVMLCSLWSDILGVERVGVEDNFFELAGQSLLAVRVVSRAREAFGIEIPLVTIFERPTVAAMAAFVSEAMERRPSPVAP